MKARSAKGPAWVVVLALCGCIPSGPKPARLDASKAKAVDIILVGGGSAFCVHGKAAQLKAVVTLEDGKKLETWARGSSRHGKLEFSAFEWSSSYGMVDGNGLLRLTGDVFAVMDRKITVRARVAGRPEIANEVTVAPAFDCGGLADFSGMSGRSGYTGQAGRQGRAGESGNSSKQATDGEDGGHGQDGGDAGQGEPGPHVEVALGFIESQQHGKLVMVRVRPAGSAGACHYLLSDPKSARQIAVTARGGSGGSGGSGGRGGSGGSGGSNNIVDAGDGGNGGSGGDGGRGGNGGDGGDGGAITVYFDERYPELRGLVSLSTGGGDGGWAGRGGSGGTAGSGGSSASGQRGTAGRAGVAGESGRSGRRGRDGSPPGFVAVSAQELFAAERERGIPVVME